MRLSFSEGPLNIIKGVHHLTVSMQGKGVLKQIVLEKNMFHN
ncbi:hypothetical protein [Clostridium sp. Marseille-Q2269]|nr:hypothetical protein [Clostridium sp. Marseille-Q2269]